ncbi:hypothetical protein [Crossiella sp. CA198]|uniref:hypothetical protein n=1 Tax=Crossiella sp. CA198 TaxID=3455607 RepID=UPI003F8CF47D
MVVVATCLAALTIAARVVPDPVAAVALALAALALFAATLFRQRRDLFVCTGSGTPWAVSSLSAAAAAFLAVSALQGDSGSVVGWVVPSVAGAGVLLGAVVLSRIGLAQHHHLADLHNEPSA